MPLLSATAIGALLGLGTQMYSNALRKLPYMRRKTFLFSLTFCLFLGNFNFTHSLLLSLVQIHGSTCWEWGWALCLCTSFSSGRHRSSMTSTRCLKRPRPLTKDVTQVYIYLHHFSCFPIFSTQGLSVFLVLLFRYVSLLFSILLCCFLLLVLCFLNNICVCCLP